VRPFMMETMKGSWFVGASAGKKHGENARPRLVSHRRWPSMVAAEYGSPPGDRRPCRRRGRPLWSSLGRGRPLTAAVGARNRV
jgi:hypothetical protein